MNAPPPDLDPSLLEQVLQRHWGIRIVHLAYLTVGFGDHHWQASTDRAERYFVTVRDLRLDGRTKDPSQAVPLLEQTFQATRQLKQLTGLAFILPALPNRSGSMVVPLGETFVVSVFEWIEVTAEWTAEATTVAELVAQLHRASRRQPVQAVHEDFQIPHRSALETALVNLERPWLDGPYGEPARAELAAHQASVRSALDRYDTLVRMARDSAVDWCFTHGEPGGGNLVRDQAGRCYLVDWESARLAPRERDLVELASHAEAVALYMQMTGGPPLRADLLDLYRLWYALAETSVYVRQFRAPHTVDDNLRQSWQNFLSYVPGRSGSEV